MPFCIYTAPVPPDGPVARSPGDLLNEFHFFAATDESAATHFCDGDLVTADIAPVLFADFLYSHVITLLQLSFIYRLSVYLSTGITGNRGTVREIQAGDAIS